MSSEARMFFLAVAIAIVIGFGFRFAHGEEVKHAEVVEVVCTKCLTPDQWWAIVISIEQHQDRLDVEEKRFIANVKNRLAVSEDARPTPEHASWLLHIRDRLSR